jgi:hypothetical protein
MATLHIGECGSHLYRPQELEIYLYPAGSKYEANNMAQVDQRLRTRSELSPGHGECGWPCHKFDLIWVIVDRFTKSTHFIPVHTKYEAEKCAEIYIAHVLCLHGVLKTIISDRGSQFVSHFWEQLHASLRTHLFHNSAYRPQTDGQTE